MLFFYLFYDILDFVAGFDGKSILIKIIIYNLLNGGSVMKKILLLLIICFSSFMLTSCGFPVFGENKDLDIATIINSKLSDVSEFLDRDSFNPSDCQNFILLIEYKVDSTDPYLKHYDCYQIKKGSVHKENVCYIFNDDEAASKYASEIETSESENSHVLEGNIFSFSRNWFMGYSSESIMEVAKGSFAKNESIAGYILLKA